MRVHTVCLGLLVLALCSATAGPAVAATATQTTGDCDYPLAVTDATGQEIPLADSPESVVALQPSDAQTVYEIGAQDRLVGLPHNDATSDLDRGDRTDVSDGFRVDVERVIDLDPDLVLAGNITSRETVRTLRTEANLTVYHFREARSLDDVRDNVRRTGRLTGECEGATETVAWMDDQLAVVEDALADADRPLAYYAMGEDGTTAGTETFIHEALTTAGVENVAERAGIRWYGQINPETVIQEDPEWVVYPDDRDEPPVPETVRSTTAYRNENFVAVDANRISQPAPRVVDAIVDVFRTVHPEEYERVSDELDRPAPDGQRDDGQSRTDTSLLALAIGVALVAALLVGTRLQR